MNRITKRVLSAVIVLAMVLSTITVTFAEEAKTIKVTMSIERFTIGQGFLVEPMTVEVNEGASVQNVLEKAAEKKNIKLNGTTSEYGYYLESISNADTGVINIPQTIQDMASIDVDYGSGYAYHYDAPTNDSTNKLFEDEQKLGTGSYTGLSGWLYSINNKESSNGMSAQPVKDGDVVRIQFSVYAGGADLGFHSWYDNIESAKLADKDKLMKQVAGVDAKGELKEARAEAVSVLEKYDAAQEEVDKALSNLGYVEETTEPETTTAVSETTTRQETTSETTTIAPLKKVTIKKLTNVKKYKVKIKINKVTGAKGYQYRYATNKKFKKSKVKTTTKTTYITKKLSSKVRCYVKVRAYRIINGKKCFGKWSKVKSLKVKK